MRIADYIRLSWDQLKRRKVVTGLCAIGISIGCASIVVAMSVGESAQVFAEKQLNSFLKMDEITVTPNKGVSDPSAQNASKSDNSEAEERGQITDQKLEVIRNIPHVTAVAAFQQLGYMQMETADERKSDLEIIGTDLNTLTDFGHEFMQGAASDLTGTVILNYGATLGLVDEETMDKLIKQLNENPYDDALMQQYRNLSRTPSSLYQRQIRLIPYAGEDGKRPQASSPLRVSGVLKKPAGSTDDMVMYDKKAYVSLETAELLQQELKIEGDSVPKRGTYNSLIVKVDDQKNVERVEKQIKKLVLNTSTNLHQIDRLKEQFAIVRTIALGIGLFVLFIASISIVVAMTMSTYQRRRQIGIMKVLGANLKQIRNMFIIEAALLGLVGGLVGIMLSYWIVWAINGAAAGAMSDGSGETIIFISSNFIPIGIAFAIMTGVISGLYPAISASRTDALTAIKRD
ncbi:ABC transporter permease [Paenibacillus melissococcoides]|uniref:ABC transporter permease n=1 Tax=Paenibacillus melissococcoides TaxID=2912268 RepID=A0ABM9G6R7_9BACL|nr:MULTISPECIES: ABC transporter permease [Paenibacillus]MEB9893819.1 ABC transporter permease [Bacillus cereus]CAH8247056.1 ABC transporter permease [Paenibacillus melissococcoides]CAH8716609.1 ABC transporter permease [Paenibacillus melissococcoides]CAH8717573.1 ABC transporter permease [Paenibacillus melissococcoides]GIO81062.1 peptide ABC transporter permease [Paenibacillus dendritiformis]